MSECCEAYADRLIEFAWDDLPAVNAREVELHAASCHACRAELASIRALRRTVERLAVETPPEGGEHILSAAAREVTGGEDVPEEPLRARWRFPALPTWAVRTLALVAALLVAGGTVAWVLHLHR